MENLFGKNVDFFYQTENVQLLLGDTFALLKKLRPASIDMIFADPPYELKELAEIPDIIFDKQLLKPDGLFILEHSAKNSFVAHPQFDGHRNYGNVNFSFFLNK